MGNVDSVTLAYESALLPSLPEGAFVLFLFLLDSPPFSMRPSVTRGPLALPNCRGSLLLAGSKGSWFNPKEEKESQNPDSIKDWDVSIFHYVSHYRKTLNLKSLGVIGEFLKTSCPL